MHLYNSAIVVIIRPRHRGTGSCSLTPGRAASSLGGALGILMLLVDSLRVMIHLIILGPIRCTFGHWVETVLNGLLIPLGLLETIHQMSK